MGTTTAASTPTYALPFELLREAIYKNQFRKIEGNPWPTAILDRGGSRGQAQLRPAFDSESLMPPEQAQACSKIMWEQQKGLDDLTADTMDGLAAEWLRQAHTPDGDAVIEHYLHTGRWEQLAYDRRVTDWEVVRNFERA